MTAASFPAKLKHHGRWRTAVWMEMNTHKSSPGRAPDVSGRLKIKWRAVSLIYSQLDPWRTVAPNECVIHLLQSAPIIGHLFITHKENVGFLVMRRRALWTPWHRWLLFKPSTWNTQEVGIIKRIPLIGPLVLQGPGSRPIRDPSTQGAPQNFHRSLTQLLTNLGRQILQIYESSRRRRSSKMNPSNLCSPLLKCFQSFFFFLKCKCWGRKQKHGWRELSSVMCTYFLDLFQMQRQTTVRNVSCLTLEERRVYSCRFRDVCCFSVRESNRADQNLIHGGFSPIPGPQRWRN